MKKVILHKKKTEEEVPKMKNRKFFVTLTPAISARFNKQLERLSCGPGILARMAIIRFIEEEERKQ